MKIEFEQLKEDLSSFYYYQYWAAPERKKHRVLFIVVPLCVLTTMLLIIFYMLQKSNSYNHIGFIAIAAFTCLWGYFGVKNFNKNRIERIVGKVLSESENKDLLGPQSLDFKDQYIEMFSKNEESKLKYDGIKKIRSDDRYYFLYVNSFSAIVIPKKAIGSEEEIGKFNSLLKSKVIANKP